MVDEDMRFTEQHEWLILRADGSVRVGITDYAQEALGDVVFVSLPEVGTQVKAGDAIGEVESTKSVSEIYAPITGEIISANNVVETAPETINEDPYGEGWLITIEPEADVDIAEFLDAQAYDALHTQS